LSPIEVPEINLASSEADITAARELFLEYQRWLNLDLSFQGFADEVAALPGSYTPPAGRLLLASLSGQIVGCVALRPLQDGDCEMKRLYLRPEGRGTGLGRRLVEAVIGEARQIGYRRILLDTLPVMGDAQRLYSKLGFADVPPYRENPVPGARFLALEL
jgi:GNAT superfamily N-acetyltransferase